MTSPAPLDEIRDIHERRLHQLRKQEAAQGLNTPPEITNEIEALEAKLGVVSDAAHPMLDRSIRRAIRRRYDDDLDFVIDQVAKFGHRLTKVENFLLGESAERPKRQLILNAWLGGMSLALLFLIARQLGWL